MPLLRAVMLSSQIRYSVFGFVFLLFTVLLSGQTTVEYTSPGSHSFTVPAGINEVTLEILVGDVAGNRFPLLNRSGGSLNTFSMGLIMVSVASECDNPLVNHIHYLSKNDEKPMQIL